MDKKEKEISQNQQESTEKDTRSHKEKFLAKLKEGQGEDYNPSDDEMWDISGENWQNLQAENKGMKDVNDKLAELISKDGRLGMFISKIVGGTSVPKAIGQVYGDTLGSMSDEELEEYESGYNEYNDRQNELVNKSRENESNIDQFYSDLSEYAETKGYDEEQKNALYDQVVSFAENILNGIISKEIIESVDKANNYDEDVQEAADTGLVEGRNEKIEAEFREEDNTGDNMPDLTDANSIGGTERAKVRNVNQGGLDMSDFPTNTRSKQIPDNYFSM